MVDGSLQALKYLPSWTTRVLDTATFKRVQAAKREARLAAIRSDHKSDRLRELIAQYGR